MVEWKSDYATGVRDVDEQHQKLFMMVNDFEQSVRTNQAESSFEGALKFLANYVAVHFKCEEGCMAAMRCPSAAANKEAHAQFLRVFRNFVKRLKTEGYSKALASELLQTMQQWLIGHICGVDLRLKQCTPAGRRGTIIGAASD